MTFSHTQPNTTAKVERIQHGIDAGIALCLGLIPSFHLLALQLILVLILASVLLRGRRALTGLPRFSRPHALILQFAVYFFLNALLFTSLDGNMRHYQRVALESWGMTFLGFALTWLYLGNNRDFMIPLQKWMPLGLTISFITMSYFFSGPQGARAQAFSTNALVPPMWYLTLTLISFCDFNTMSARNRLIRVALLGASAVMCLYSGGRMILIIWLLTTVFLALYIVRTKQRTAPVLKDLSVVFVIIVAVLGLLYLLDAVTGGTIAMRFTYTIDTLSQNGLSGDGFLRLQIWASALEVIQQNLPFGGGQVNERLLIHEVLKHEWWFRAHQTYLSYLIAGGWIAFVSGILFQSAGLVLFTRSMMPAALGLVVVLGLGGLTDSVFQSVFAVQLYMLLLLLLVHSQTIRKSSPEHT